MSGQSCTFSQGGTTVVVFCENGCCGNECCEDADFNEETFALVMAVILGFLLLVALLILILCCCFKRGKKVEDTEKLDDRRGHGNRVASLTSLGHGTAGKIVQTGDPNPTPRDHLLWGRSSRWSPYPKQPSSRRSSTWNTRPTDRSVQTDDPPPNYKSTPWAPSQPWRPSNQVKSLQKSAPPPLDTHMNHGVEEHGPYYPVHKHPLGVPQFQNHPRSRGRSRTSTGLSTPSSNYFEEERV